MTIIPEIGPRPIGPSEPSSDLTPPSPPSQMATASLARRARPPAKLRPDRDPAITAQMARERGRRFGARWAALSSGAAANLAAAQSCGDALARGRHAAALENEAACEVASDDDMLSRMGF